MMTKKEKKRVPELRFAGFEEEWERKVLGKRCLKIGDGLHGTPKYVDDSGIYFINGNNIVSGKIEIYENTKQVSEKVYKKNEKEINENTLLISINGTIGNIGWYNNEPVMLGKSVGYLTFPEKPSFEFHYLNTSKAQRFFVSQLTGTTIKNLSLKTLRETSIYIPKLEEQQKIASFLTSIDTRLQQLEKKKTLLEQYKKGVMQKIFSQEIRFKDDDGKEFGKWEEKTIKEIFKSLKGKGIPKRDVDENGEDKCILYGELYTQYSEVVFDVKSKTNSTEGLLSKKGDLLMPSSTTTTGIDLANITALNIDNVRLGGDIIILRSKIKISNIFYAYYLSNYKKHEIASRAQGITIVHIYYNSIKDLIIDVPKLEEQTKIAHFLSALDRKIAVVDEQIEGTKEWKKGLLQRMFV